MSPAPAITPDRSAVVGEAARWLSELHQWPSPIIPAIRQRFGLSALEAIQATRAARSIMSRNPTPLATSSLAREAAA